MRIEWHLCDSTPHWLWHIWRLGTWPTCLKDWHPLADFIMSDWSVLVTISGEKVGTTDTVTPEIYKGASERIRKKKRIKEHSLKIPPIHNPCTTEPSICILDWGERRLASTGEGWRMATRQKTKLLTSNALPKMQSGHTYRLNEVAWRLD